MWPTGHARHGVEFLAPNEPQYTALIATVCDNQLI